MTSQAKDPKVLEQLRCARQLRDEHEQAFIEAVRLAAQKRGGHTVQEIAEAAGISRERVYQIRDGRR